MSRQLTMNDIARIANVSVATVSRVLADAPNVRHETRERVLRVVEDHHYEPSHVARSLTTRRTQTLGVVIDDMANPFFTELAKGVEAVLREHGYTMLLTASNWDAAREHQLVRMLIRNRVDGVLIAAVNPDSDSVQMLRKVGVPFVLMNCWSRDDKIGYVTGDSYTGGQLAAECLLRTGVRQYLCLAGVPHQSTEERRRGFVDAIEAAGSGDHLAVYSEVCTSDDGYKIVPRLIALHQIDTVPTGIFTSNDFVAMGIIDGLLDHNVTVPEQASVIGYDNIEFASRYRVPLTTVDQPKQTMGELAASELIKCIEDREYRSRTLLLKPRLITRKSCRPVEQPQEATGLQ